MVEKTLLKIEMVLEGSVKDIMDNDSMMNWLGDLYLKCVLCGIELKATLNGQPLEISAVGFIPGGSTGEGKPS